MFFQDLWVRRRSWLGGRAGSPSPRPGIYPGIRRTSDSSSRGCGGGEGLVAGLLLTDVNHRLENGGLLFEDHLLHTPIPLRERWATQIQETVAQLHNANLVWGDAKAENVMIDKNNDAWLIDLGRARMPPFTSPPSAMSPPCKPAPQPGLHHRHPRARPRPRWHRPRLGRWVMARRCCLKNPCPPYPRSPCPSRSRSKARRAH